MKLLSLQILGKYRGRSLSLLSKLEINCVLNFGVKTEMEQNVDNRLKTFTEVCDEIAAESGYKAKAEILGKFFKTGHDGAGFKGDLLLWVQMLIPQASQSVYNLQNKQMIKLFGRIFKNDVQAMHEDLEQEGDVSVVLSKHFEASLGLKPKSESTLYLQDVKEFLRKLEQVTKEDDQCEVLQKFCKQATVLDLRTVIRLIKQDLRINARARHILDAFGPSAYQMYQASRDLQSVVKTFTTNPKPGVAVTVKKTTNAKGSNVKVMTPLSPMLANACKSVDEAFKKSPEGLYSEIKYDGERVQIHKKGNEFRYFSRNLKPVMDHKIKRFKEFIPKAFPGVGDMILDSEIILVDKVTGELLPFGSLGAHKKKEYATSEVCLFVFDCILFNDENLTNLPFKERRQILEDNIEPIKSYVQLSESYFLKTKTELSLMTAKVLKANLEGVVLKSPSSTYQPGKRGWLKVKKDYLFGGKMADTADLVVLGAWYGSGKKGGILSIFLMGCYDPRDHHWKTVTKVHSGLDDATNEEIHDKLMKLMQRADANKIPHWLLCKKSLVPDFIAQDPLNMPVWEITGAEFTKSEAHTAAGISIRFPRITRLRDDKSAEQANDLQYLQTMFEASKKNVNVDLLMADCDVDDAKAVEIDSKLNLSISPQNGKKPKRERHDESKESAAKIPKLDQSNEKSNSAKKSSQKTASKQENSSSLRQQKLNFGSTKSSKAIRPESSLFSSLNAYFDDDLSEIKYDLVESFQRNGGNKSKTSDVSNVVFHLIPTKRIKLEELRKNYKPDCHHLSVKWISDSLEAKQCLPYEPYALVL